MIDQDPIAEHKLAKLAKRHGIEQLAADTGQKRAKAHDDLVANTEFIVRLMPEAVAADIPIDTFAKLVGVSRQTLYRWKDEHPEPESKRLPLFEKGDD
jgi:DNA-binding transcriptional regulator YiaG